VFELMIIPGKSPAATAAEWLAHFHARARFAFRFTTTYRSPPGEGWACSPFIIWAIPGKAKKVSEKSIGCNKNPIKDYLIAGQVIIGPMDMDLLQRSSVGIVLLITSLISTAWYIYNNQTKVSPVYMSSYRVDRILHDRTFCRIFTRHIWKM
jgi:hypothetical protein